MSDPSVTPSLPIIARVLTRAPPLLRVGTLIGIIGLGGATHAAGHDICWPTLAFKAVRFSAMQPPRLERKWTAVLAVDAGACEAASGSFTIGFSQLKENAPEIDFQARFIWQQPTVEVTLDFSADEAMERYWLDHVAPCACRE